HPHTFLSFLSLYSPLFSLLFFLMLPRPPTSTLFPYTTLFRSEHFSQAARFAGLQVEVDKLCEIEPQDGQLVLPGPARFDLPLCLDRKSTRLNSSHVSISYAVFCLKKKKKINNNIHLIASCIIHEDANSIVVARPA